MNDFSGTNHSAAGIPVAQYVRYLPSILACAVAILISLLLLAQPFAFAATTENATASAKVSFTFDDGMQSAYQYAAPALSKYGLKGTSYVITGCVGMTTVPNTCHADTDKAYLSWDQLSSLQSQYGWEIGSHTVSHPYMASTDASDGQPTMLTLEQIRNELVASKNALTSRGFAAESFASPYGDYSPTVLAEIAKVYSSHRGFADVGLNEWPYNEYLITNYQVQQGVTVAQVKAQVDQAIASNKWLVLTFHDIVTTSTQTNTNGDIIYDYTDAMLEEIAAYVKTKIAAGQIADRTISQATVSGTNLLTGGDFAGGLTNGWRTDSTTTVVADVGGNGSYPNVTSSVRFTTPATNQHAHLFSPTIPVSSSGTYLLRSFVSVQNAVNGGIAYYIDEYDASGNWISGQYKQEETSVFTENLNMVYTPSSTNVAKMSIQIIGFGTTLSAYVDTVELIALTSIVTPPQTNLVSNGDFEQGMTGWRTDTPNQLTLDNASHGSPASPANAVRLTAASTNAHLFSPSVSVAYGTSYSLAAWLNLTSLTSRSVGFYVDEYDSSGNWISGQYKADTTTLGTQEITLVYSPSSAQVTSASLQVIVVGGSGATGYIDNIRWHKS